MIENKIFWYDEKENEINLKNGEELQINLSGDQTIQIEKLYGPLIFCGVRITPDLESCKWKIERERITQDEDGNDVPAWEIICEFGGQESIDFRDESA